MSDFTFLCKEIFKGKSVVRAYYNARLKKDVLSGAVIDIGGGRNADYLSFMHRDASVNFETFDLKAGAQIDFETDALPAVDGAYDTVLFLNVMEHIYNHQHILSEVYRVTKPGGRLIGVVPFLMWYHPDHKDFFRYTHEALERIFAECGITNYQIEPLARGPFTAAAQMLMQSLPMFMRLPVFLCFHGLDSIFLLLRPKNGARYILGYYFTITRK